MIPAGELTDGVVVLRPLRLADVDAHLAGEDAELVRWLSGGPATPERVEAHVRRGQEQWAAGGPALALGIRTAADDRLIGTIDVQREQPYLAPGQVNLAYGLHPAARGHGHATRAVRLACRLAATLPGAREAVIRVDPANPASAAVAARAGFRPAGRRVEADGVRDWHVRDLRLDAPSTRPQT
jgi:RimJ/RimL family protein N-acetyltransferase